jgi:hypothetical protein
MKDGGGESGRSFSVIRVVKITVEHDVKRIRRAFGVDDKSPLVFDKSDRHRCSYLSLCVIDGHSSQQ